MNMHGIMRPVEGEADRYRLSSFEKVKTWIIQRRVFGLIVVLPTLVLASYLFLIASDQYESEAHFLVRSANSSSLPSTGLSQALSMVGAPSTATGEATSVADYLTSHDVVATLRHDNRLVERFHDADADLLSRLRRADPTPEQLLKYYRRQVDVHLNAETGITTVKVHSFRPEDSYQLVEALLRLGEKRVNMLNVRSYNDAIAVARKQLTDAENALAQSQGRLTQFRQARRDIDPRASGQAQITLVTSLDGQLSQAKAQLSAMGSMIDRSSPQYRAIAARVQALQRQVAAQSGKLTGSNEAIAADIGGYEGLQLRQEFLAKRYEAAAASLDKARDQALRQQLYLVRVVDANMPVKSLYPQRWRILLTTVVVMLLVYSIGWLIVAGVREHAA
ncbi:lipopolysaccharide biosynthesis protein [Sphingomonas sp.]|uniref:lipopolysaccharide biosynthesis protein n=1 Tax=Sphingomonas sp. TaxID=28214 RepID=UPI0025DC43AF|nr:lipopolysaccharide biosynthesis protein [Sphingomonas sp.]